MTERTYLLIKTHGRRHSGTVCHLVGPGGALPICGTRLNQHQWSLWPQQGDTRYGRSLCRRCQKQQGGM